jgi:hypothetical protein
MDKPSWMFQAGEDEADYCPAWGSGTWGSHVPCPDHGEQFVVWRGDHWFGTFVGSHDGPHDRDERWVEELACGCRLYCQKYAFDTDVRRYMETSV